MQPIVIMTRDYAEADRADNMQQVMMSREERQEAARILRERYLGTNTPDVRDSHSK